MHIILTGATGSVGFPTLLHCLASPKITRLSILSRRPFALPEGSGLDTKKAEIIVHNDFTNYPNELLETLKGAHGCIWAQGISQSQVPKDEYIRITYDYPLAAAKAFSGLAIRDGKESFNFIYVSGEGADPTEKAWSLFAKIKGRAEAALINLPSIRAYNVRPGLVDPPLEDRPPPIALRIFLTLIAPVVRNFVPSLVSPTALLSKVFVNLATGDGEPLAAGVGIEAGGRTVRSSAIRRLAAQDQ